MYGLAVLLVVIGLALGGSATDQVHHAGSPFQAIEITCTADGTRVTQSVGIAGPAGVVMRFTHGPGEWVMTWEGAPGQSKSAGSAHTAEIVWPIPPGGAKVLCHPANLGGDGDPYGQPQWWVGVRVRDSHGFHAAPRADCATWVGMSWHGGPSDNSDEEPVVWEALAELGVTRQPNDILARTGYPESTPGQWALWRDGEAVAGVVMALRPDGRVEPSQVGGCTDVVTQRSTS